MYDLEEQLNTIAWFKLRSELIPFVGEYYLSGKSVLLVGESHFIGNFFTESDAKKYSDEYIQYVNAISKDDYYDWWEGKLSDTFRFMNSRKWFNTRDVVANYMSGNSTNSHGIFDNVLKEYEDVVLKATHDRKNYNHFAYMNFFQIPSAYKGVGFTEAWSYVFGKDSEETIKECSAFSSKVLDQVINILRPKMVLFTSKEAHKNYCGQYKNLDIVKWVGHPDCAWWNRKQKDGRTYRGICGEIFESCR